ncbi:class I adenylate-forming enzyme family protein [Amycolatopsis sp. NPDC059090]|uniref:class I adenylate-forming enzyme family protein n=1 Tax=unclassified Amycolatopsis TaxID=2618356 RepID=UPI0036733AE7
MSTTPGSRAAPHNLSERLASAALKNRWLARPAYHCGGETYRFADVYAGAARAAAAFVAHGVGAGDRILLAVPDSIEFVWAFLGALRIGAIAVPVNTDLHPDELRRAGEIAEPAIVAHAPGLATSLPYYALTTEDLQLGTASPPPYAEVGPETPAFALFTSGTTGNPRLCVHTHGDPAVFEQAIASVIGMTPDDICYSMSRLYFGYGLGVSLFFPLHRGASTVLTPERATAQDAIPVLREHNVTVFAAQPSVYAQLVTHPDTAPLGRVRLALCAGEVLPPTLETRLRRILGERLLNIFGTTETGHACVANTTTAHRKSTVGRVLAPYRLRITDASGTPVPHGVAGRLELAGPTISLGVPSGNDLPRRTGESWYVTGDAASRDEDGFVHILGRLDDIEIVGGANVHPGEVEDLLLRHPAVHDAAVCSVRRRSGESGLRAYIVLATAADPSSVRAELLSAAREKLTWYKVPEDVVFLAELPRNSFGKLMRREVRMLAAESPTP